MWRTNNSDKNNSDIVLKEALLRQLSHTLKEVQLFYSQTGETCTTQEGPTALITVIEAIFLHALKRSVLETAIRSVNITDDTKPAPSFYEAVELVSHKEVRFRISKLDRINTNVGKSRAWVRLALNDGAISSYLGVLESNKKLSRFYRPAAFLRDREALDTANRLLEGLMSVHFDIPLNSSLLNSWSSEPLLMSGLWAPALRPSVQTAVDVASSMEVEEASSVPTPSSSLHSLLLLDESQALKIILGTSVPEEDHIPEKLQEEVDRKMDQLEEERKDILQRSYSYVLESCNEPPEIIQQPTVSVETAEEKLTPYSEIVSKNLTDEDRIHLWFETLETADTKPIDQGPTIEETILRIPRENSLKRQRYECGECHISISFHFGPAILCHATGKQLCENCHKSEMSVIPSRIIFNWDHGKYPIGKKAAEYLKTIAKQPMFHIQDVNRKIYSAVEEMRESLKLRKQLYLLYLYLSTCKDKKELPAESYIYEEIHLYSLADLIAVPGGYFKAELDKLIQIGKSHVLGCWVCKEKGFICEFCKDPQVIYPFDEGTNYRCGKCKAVYHEKCVIDKASSCPKCKRRKKQEKGREPNQVMQ